MTPNGDLSTGLKDKSLDLDENEGEVDGTRSLPGLSDEAPSSEAAKVLLAPVGGFFCLDNHFALENSIV